MDVYILETLCDSKQADLILNAQYIPLELIYRLESYTFSKTLIDYIGELKETELNIAYRLEAENLYHMLNSARIVLGISEEASKVLYEKETVKYIREMIQETKEYDEETKIIVEFALLTKYLLSRLTTSDELNSEIKFYGKLPFKLFSFRQANANLWFNEYLDFALVKAGKILARNNDVKATSDYLIRNIAWYLNKSQPFKYHKIVEDKNLNQTIYRIAIEFISSVSDENEYLNINTDYERLFRDSKS